MKPDDRFRIVEFNSGAREVLPWTPATAENVKQALETVARLTPNGSTDLYAGLKEGLRNLDADRATSVVLVTDGVTNTGFVEPAAFAKLLGQYDVRVFGFLMGNNSNWPLLRLITDTSGGFYAAVSNEDDIVGQIMLAKSKLGFEAMHNAEFKFSGAHVSETTGDTPAKIYRGQQRVIFGRYENGGPAKLVLNAKLTGDDKTYSTTFDFPEVDTDNPEIERLWAMAQIEQIEQKQFLGVLPPTEGENAIEHLGVTYQLVTDQTSMVVMSDESFNRRGIERRNQTRVATERAAQAVRATQGPVNRRVDTAQPMYTAPAHTLNNGGSRGGGGGGGAVDPVIILIGAVALFAGYRYLCREYQRLDDNKKG
jgi:Ca-activated chloride channel family protein